MFTENHSLDLDSKFHGALSIVNHFLGRLQMEALLTQRLPLPDPHTKVRPAVVVMVLLRSLILSEAPLYSLSRVGRCHVAGGSGFDRRAGGGTE